MKSSFTVVASVVAINLIIYSILFNIWHKKHSANHKWRCESVAYVEPHGKREKKILIDNLFRLMRKSATQKVNNEYVYVFMRCVGIKSTTDNPTGRIIVIDNVKIVKRSRVIFCQHLGVRCRLKTAVRLMWLSGFLDLFVAHIQLFIL